MTLNYDIAVDLTPEFNRQLSPKFSVSLGDHGAREYTVQILQDGEPFVIEEGSTVSIVGKKSDGHIFAYACTYFDSFVRFTIEEQMTPVSGIVTCELSIIDASGNKVGSANFTYWVEPSPVTDGEASESDLQLFQQAVDAAGDVQRILDAFGGPNVAKSTDDMVNTSKVYVYIGDETGYTYGHWYYYDTATSTWTDGGIYQSDGVNTDTTLTASGVPADAKATGDALATKQDTLTFDSTPTEGSANPVTSGGAWEAVQTDKTLAVEDKAADAKTTGNRIAELKDELENGGLLITTGMIEQGTYNSAGDVVSSSTRIRTTGFIPVEKGGTVQFAPGANAQNIFYGKFNAEKRFITDGTWGSGNINIDWDGYIILVFRKAGNENITPEEYDATTILMNSVENKAATVAEITQTENPMNPLLFDMMYFKKGAVVSGTEYSTRYEKSTFINNQFADLNAVSATGNSGYIAFLFNTINQPKVLTSGESVDYYALVKTNKQLTLKPRLSASTTWSGVFSVAVADSISLSVGYNCVKMHFTYDHTGSSAADNYRFMVFEGNNVFTDLEAEFVFVRGETFLGWAKTLQAAEEEYSTDLLFWGDSLTAGAGGGDTSYPKVCSETLGLSRLNCGVGGESANTVAARQGGNNIIIPAGAVNGSYPIDAGFADLFGGIVQPLRQGDGAGSGSKILVNGIECNLANSGGNYVISGYTGTAITTPAIGTFAGNNYTGKVVCIFVGQNGSTFDGLSDYNARIAIIESMIKHINHNRYVILGLSTGTNASREADDRAMLAKFGNKFFPTRKMLVENGMTIAGLTPTAQDTTDISNGTVPTSLRSDGIHLNSYGYTALGKMVAEKIVSLGYLT